MSITTYDEARTLAETRSEGFEEGFEIGMKMLARLVLKLLDLGRDSEISRALSDSEYRKKLYEEFSIDDNE